MAAEICRDFIVQHWTTINGVPLERRIQVFLPHFFLVCRRCLQALARSHATQIII